MSKLIIADAWIEQLCESQGINYQRCNRIIIDAQAGSVVTMYVKQWGDDGLLELTEPEIIEPEVRA